MVPRSASTATTDDVTFTRYLFTNTPKYCSVLQKRAITGTLWMHALSAIHPPISLHQVTLLLFLH
ncbi:hypothetical protein PGB90_008980 [Kerria lacca]